jgi:hypothetical protein
MNLAKFKNICISIIILCIWGLVFWVSRIPFRKEPAPTPSPTLPKPVFVIITSPANEYVGTHLIQLKGQFVGYITNITYDVINPAGIQTNQRSFQINWGQGPEDVTTNYFECPDVSLSIGTNFIILHTFFENGRNLMNHVKCVLDYSNSTNRPHLKLLWPPNETVIAGCEFTLEAQVKDPSTTVHVTVSHQNASPLEFDDAVISHDGSVFVKDLPLEVGTNDVNVMIKDEAGNSDSAHLSVVGSPVKISMRPIHFQRTNHLSVAVSGLINDPSLTVLINGVPAVVSRNGQWKVDDLRLPWSRNIYPPPRPGFLPNVPLYFAVSAFKGKTLIATQRFVVGDPGLSPWTSWR